MVVAFDHEVPVKIAAEHDVARRPLNEERSEGRIAHLDWRLILRDGRRPNFRA